MEPPGEDLHGRQSYFSVASFPIFELAYDGLLIGFNMWCDRLMIDMSKEEAITFLKFFVLGNHMYDDNLEYLELKYRISELMKVENK